MTYKTPLDIWVIWADLYEFSENSELWNQGTRGTQLLLVENAPLSWTALVVIAKANSNIVTTLTIT